MTSSHTKIASETEGRVELLVAPDRLIVRTYESERPDPVANPYLYVSRPVDTVYVREVLR